MHFKAFVSARSKAIQTTKPPQVKFDQFWRSKLFIIKKKKQKQKQKKRKLMKCWMWENLTWQNPIHPLYNKRGIFLHLGASYWPLRLSYPTLSDGFCPFQFVYVWDNWWLIALFVDQGFRFWFYKVFFFQLFLFVISYFIWCELKNENITKPKKKLKTKGRPKNSQMQVILFKIWAQFTIKIGFF